MGVFMAVEVRDLKTGGLNFLYLRRDFGDQLIAIEPSQHGARGKGGKTGIELPRFGGANCQQSIDRPRRRHRRSIYQYDVAADREFRYQASSSYRVFESGAVGHQRRGRHDAGGTGFQNGPIHPDRKAEIIRVDDQLSHQESVAARDGRVPRLTGN